MSLEIVQVDAFTSSPFRGNPAAVCVLNDPASDTWMQAVAAEMNLSETAFLRRRGGGFSIRYFTPRVEVPLCGHATLASAHVLWEAGEVPPSETIRFHTRDSALFASREASRVCLDFPSFPVVPIAVPVQLPGVLGTSVMGAYRGDTDWLLVELEDESTLRALRPDLGRLEADGYGCIAVTAACGSGAFDFVSRCFAPGEGIPEDPVTGSAHCCLGPFWAGRLGRTDLTGYQASSRGGTVHVRVRGSRVDLLGQAVTVMRSQLMVDPN
ncbi:MAG: PhzF family phenazine biosynthesis protein [Chloroflexi bacterium]|nr:PhzF family phenazine biosynthesis protein [Chloroflexota bacterium]